ncbi:MAG TPA: DUF5666 domain-containing protein [Dehalococcoidia bacterium]|nr:DUF5666 domain-containing protein [Dehalococcoidia bacterium]
MNKLGLLGPALGSVIALSACGSGAAHRPASAVSTPPAAETAAAQATPATNPLAREMGPVTAVSGKTVTLQDGSSFMLSSQTDITERAAGTVADLQTGSYVAVTAKRQPDNTLLASVVVVFPARSGASTFQRPMDEGNLMTNATIDKVNGSTFTVTFTGGGDRVTLAPAAQIQRVVKASDSDVKVGSTVSASVENGVAQSLFIQ